MKIGKIEKSNIPLDTSGRGKYKEVLDAIDLLVAGQQIPIECIDNAEAFKVAASLRVTLKYRIAGTRYLGNLKYRVIKRMQTIYVVADDASSIRMPKKASA